MRSGSWLAVAIVALSLALGLVACGGGDGGASTASTSSGSAGGGSGGGEAKGGEASIEEFGDEAGGSDREQILAVFNGYLNAVADEDYEAACSDLSAASQRSLEQFGGEAVKGKGCATILPALLAPTAGQVARQQANGKVTKVRDEGDRAFVVFKAPGAKLYQLTMVKEDGSWKAATLAAAVLVPEL
jgi:hypothetical protein